MSTRRFLTGVTVVVSLSLSTAATLRWLGETIRLSIPRTEVIAISSICLDACGSHTSMTFASVRAMYRRRPAAPSAAAPYRAVGPDRK